MKSAAVVRELSRLMWERRMRQSQAARLIGVSQQTVSKWMRGVTAPGYRGLVLIAETFPELRGLVEQAIMEPLDEPSSDQQGHA